MPRPASKPPLFRRLRAAGASVGLFAATVGLFGVFEIRLIKSLLFDQAMVIDASADVLERPLVRSGVAEATAKLIEERAISPEARAELKAANLNVDADLQASTSLLTQNAEFRAEFSRAVGEVHSYILVDRTAVPQVDISPYLAQVRADTASVDARYAKAITDVPDLQLKVPLGGLPDLTGLRPFVDRIESNLALASLAAALFAFAVHPKRPRLLRRAGRSLIGCAVLHAAAAVVLPVAAASTTNDSYPIVTEVLQLLLARLIAPAGVLLAVGIGAWVIANRWQRAQAERHTHVGADAFLAPEQALVTFGTGRPAGANPAAPKRPVANPAASRAPANDAPVARPAPTPPAPTRERHGTTVAPATPAPLAEAEGPEAAPVIARPVAVAVAAQVAATPDRPITPPQQWPDAAKVTRIGAEGDSPAALHALSGLPTKHRAEPRAQHEEDRPRGA